MIEINSLETQRHLYPSFVTFYLVSVEDPSIIPNNQVSTLQSSFALLLQNF